MRRAYLVALYATVVVGGSPFAVASAAAAPPEYRYCVKAQPPKTGEFTDSGCSTHAAMAHRGSWEIGSWAQAKSRTLKGSFGATKIQLYEPKNKAEPWAGGTRGADLAAVKCAKGHDEGEVTGPNTSTERIALSTCELLGRKCTTSGAKRGEIVTVPLAGELGPVSGGVGTHLMPVSGDVLAEFECTPGPVTLEVLGSAIAVDSGNVNVLAKQGTRTLAINAETWAQEYVFGEFPSGEGPFYMTAEGSSEGSPFAAGASVVGVAMVKLGGVAEIEA
jgi:hypothetical protein